jgi:predicted transcriptional regulator
MSGEVVTVKVSPAVKKKLDQLKRYPRESYDAVIARLASLAEEEGITEDDIKDIEEAIEDIKAGRVYSTVELKKTLGLD